jgi:amidohydrolase
MVNFKQLGLALAMTTGLIACTMINTVHAQVPAPQPAAQQASVSLIAKVNAAIDADTERLTAIFKDLHQNPEIAFTEVRTAGVIAKELTALGFTVTTGIGKTGVVGVYKNGPGKTLWFRADMDANAVKEAHTFPYAATKPQKLEDGSELNTMHACGHDAHVTWMLGLAKAMVTLKSEWSGTLVVYGQPAEEVGLGAQAMVKDGMWERGFPKPDFALASHTAPGPVGYISNSEGVRMAGVDQLDITFTGVGGHGSTPEMTIDPVVMAAQAVMAYQTIISRTLDPQAAAVLTVGSIQAGRDNNVIPQTAKLLLNLRWLKPDVRDIIIRRIDEINNGIAIAAGVSPENLPIRKLSNAAPSHPFRVMKGNSGPLVNDPKLVDLINPQLTGLLGNGKVVNNFPTVMGSEDFQDVYAASKTPYVFLLIGVAPVEMFQAALKAGKPFPYSNHNPEFFVDLAAIPIGTKVNTLSAITMLGK